MKIIGNLDWRHPLVRARIMIATPLQMALAAAGRWEPLAAAEKEVVQTDEVAVTGDRPAQRRLVYKHERPEFEDAENVVYTPAGLALKDGRIIAGYSIRPPSTAEILKASSIRETKTIPAGTIIESETPYTYGDWVGDFVRALIRTDRLIEPLVLPDVLAKKAYVVRDVETLGIDYVIASEPLRIEKARILRKRLPGYYWGPEDVAAYRARFHVTPPPARKGSILYLGRFDTVSEAAQRKYPSVTVARIVESLGGKVFDTKNASPEKFNELASEMETVIADQGSALFGVMHAQTKNVIELAEDDWWHNANLFIANGAGVDNYAVIHLRGKDEAALRARIEGHLRGFGVL